ncbi:MAG: MsnO8 family LLM class oxidoreductase [Pseudomonadota bacterium]
MQTLPRLCVLDPAPLFEGQTATHALNDTVTVARACEDMGYHSYWVQEHHNTPSFASVAPEILIAHIASATQWIKVGAGGVMLPNYSPLKVAEQFTTLSALYPGRIELGIGRATGADPRTSAALLGPGAKTFPVMTRLLMDWLLDAAGEVAIPDNHRAGGIHARPSAQRPDLWILASSPQSAAVAGAMGLPMAFADFLAPGGARAAADAYRSAFSPSAFATAPRLALALVALAAETEARAHELARPATAWNAVRAAGKFIPFPSQQVAENILSRMPQDTIDAAESRSITGTGEIVAQTVLEKADACGADSVYILTIAQPVEARIQSYKAISDAYYNDGRATNPQAARL